MAMGVPLQNRRHVAQRAGMPAAMLAYRGISPVLGQAQSSPPRSLTHAHPPTRALRALFSPLPCPLTSSAGTQVGPGVLPSLCLLAHFTCSTLLSVQPVPCGAFFQGCMHEITTNSRRACSCTEEAQRAAAPAPARSSKGTCLQPASQPARAAPPRLPPMVSATHRQGVGRVARG